MKNKIIRIFILSFVFLFSGCGKGVKNAQQDENNSAVKESETIVTSEISSDETGSIRINHERSERNDRETIQNLVYDVNDSLKPEVIQLKVTAKCSGNIKSQISVSNLYNVDFLHSGVVGLVGAPFGISFDSKSIRNPILSFCYDKESLRGIPEDNLMILYYDEENAVYNEIENFNINKDNCTVNTHIYEDGVYMLVDAYQWLGCWGEDVSEYAYEIDKSQYISDWERECDTGDIMEIADVEWAMQNAPYFSVSTPEQLAGAVYYVNAVSEYGEEVCITLESDIDLAGYDWKPMGWGGAGNNHFCGIIDGQGHTIKNLSIIGSYRSGFIGYGLNTQVYNISFTDAEVMGNSYVGIVGGEIYMSDNWHDIHVSGKVTALGDDDYGTIIGRATEMTFNNCTYDEVIVNNEVFGYPSYLQKRKDEVVIEEVFTLTLNEDGSISRDDIEGYQNIGWYIMQGDELLLHRNAENELVLDKQYVWGNKVYLTAYINGAYIRVSNIIEIN